MKELKCSSALILHYYFKFAFASDSLCSYNRELENSTSPQNSVPH
jgi:hypothetical protein